MRDLGLDNFAVYWTADCSAPACIAGIEFDSKASVVLGKHIYDVIEEEVKRSHADLVVIGTHGRRGIRRLLLGSVAEGLTRFRAGRYCLFAEHRAHEQGWQRR